MVASSYDLWPLQNYLRRNWMLRQPLLTHWLPKYPVFWFTLTQWVRLPMVTYPSLCSPCVTYGTLCHAVGHQVLSTLTKTLPPLPSEVEDFPDGGNHSKHVPLPTYLASLQTIYYNARFVFIIAKTAKFCLWWRH